MAWRNGRVERTSGDYSGTTTWEKNRNNMVGVNASPHDLHDQDLADSIEECIHGGGQNSPIGDISWGGNKITNLGDGASTGDAVNFGQLQQAATPYVTAAGVGGTANGITIAVTPSPSAYVTGGSYRFFAEALNTGAVTLKVGTLAAVAMRRSDGNAFEGGEIETGTEVLATYDGTVFRTNVGLRQEFMTEAQFNALSTKHNGVIYALRA